MEIRSTPQTNTTLLQQGPDSSRYLPNNRSPGSPAGGPAPGALPSALGASQGLPQASPPSRPSSSVEVQISDAARQAAANDPSPGLRGRASTADEALPPVPPQGNERGTATLRAPAFAPMGIDSGMRSAQSGEANATWRTGSGTGLQGGREGGESSAAPPPTYGSRRAIQMFREIAGLGLANPQATGSALRSFA